MWLSFTVGAQPCPWVFVQAHTWLMPVVYSRCELGCWQQRLLLNLNFIFKKMYTHLYLDKRLWRVVKNNPNRWNQSDLRDLLIQDQSQIFQIGKTKVHIVIVIIFKECLCNNFVIIGSCFMSNDYVGIKNACWWLFNSVTCHHPCHTSPIIQVSQWVMEMCRGGVQMW